MTNIFGSPRKVRTRDFLFRAAEQALQEEGWKVERVRGAGKASVRRIRKGTESKLVCIRTSQDTSIAFPRNREDSAWLTLGDVDVVVASSVDNRDEPRFALVHMIDGDEMRRRFDEAYERRLSAGHRIPIGRGIWIRLYESDDGTPTRAGAGAGLQNPPIAKVPLSEGGLASAERPALPHHSPVENDLPPLSISEAKERLAKTLGVDPSAITITVAA